MRRPVAIIEALALAALASASAEPRPVTMTLRSKRDPDLEPPPPPEPPRPIRREAGVRERARLRRRKCRTEYDARMRVDGAREWRRIAKHTSPSNLRPWVAGVRNSDWAREADMSNTENGQ